MFIRDLKRLAVKLNDFRVNARGNVAIIFGLCLLPLLLTIGIAFDLNNQNRIDQRLANIADAVALAAAHSTGDPAEMNALAAKYMEANGASDLGPGVTLTGTNVSFDPETNRVTVELTARMQTTLMKLAGVEHTNVTARSVTGLEATAGVPVSLALVLDVSGSMDWYGKIEDLKVAATSLLDQLAAADTEGNRLRTGLVTYSSEIQDTVPMDWGITHTRSVIQTLTADGGTASTRAMNRAKTWMIGEDEEQQHLQASEQEPLEFVIFMTDGDNNDSRDDTRTQRRCDQIKAHDVTIFSVAFQAPAGGRALLEYCASGESYYFDAQNSEQFLEAFDIILERIQTSALRIVE